MNVTPRGLEDGPVPTRILETALYVEDPEVSGRFYEQALGLKPISAGDRLVAMDAGGGSVLLLFRRGSTTGGASFPGGWIPPHDGRGGSHFAFAVAEGSLGAWRDRLSGQGVEVESEVRWERGGTSLYFRDPDGHSVELATPGVWSVY
jgi:catechol 2,3-dioxygenase-like lactoylglutathione lyase family enzyme